MITFIIVKEENKLREFGNMMVIAEARQWIMEGHYTIYSTFVYTGDFL